MSCGILIQGVYQTLKTLNDPKFGLVTPRNMIPESYQIWTLKIIPKRFSFNENLKQKLWSWNGIASC